MGLSAAVFHSGGDDLSDSLHIASEIIDLGNVAMIAYLRARTSQLLPNGSIVAEKILYSGSHSGDVIGVGDLGLLKSEMRILGDDEDADMQVFCRSLSVLVEAALENGADISFV